MSVLALQVPKPLSVILTKQTAEAKVDHKYFASNMSAMKQVTHNMSWGAIDDKGSVRITIGKETAIAKNSDWIVRNQDGSIKVYTDVAFRKEYEDA